MYCLNVVNLHKTYGKVHAVRGVSFKVKQGICFGLLGSNGAGKSTMIEILEGIKEPTSGEIFFHSKPRDFKTYKEKIGIQFQSTALQDYMKVKEALEVFSSFYQAPYPIKNIIEVCRLHDILDRDHRHLSGGQRKKLLLGLSLINNPELIFLDEPTTGLDPSSRKLFWELVEFIKIKQKRTIVLTTHYMDEAYALCDEILIIDKGKVIAEGTPKQLLSKHFEGARVLFPLSYEKHFNSSFSYSISEKLRAVEFKTKCLESLLEQFLLNKIPMDQMEIRPYTLDDLFLHLTGHEAVHQEQ